MLNDAGIIDYNPKSPTQFNSAFANTLPAAFNNTDADEYKSVYIENNKGLKKKDKTAYYKTSEINALTDDFQKNYGNKYGQVQEVVGNFKKEKDNDNDGSESFARYTPLPRKAYNFIMQNINNGDIIFPTMGNSRSNSIFHETTLYQLLMDGNDLKRNGIKVLNLTQEDLLKYGFTQDDIDDKSSILYQDIASINLAGYNVNLAILAQTQNNKLEIRDTNKKVLFYGAVGIEQRGKANGFDAENYKKIFTNHFQNEFEQIFLTAIKNNKKNIFLTPFGTGVFLDRGHKSESLKVYKQSFQQTVKKYQDVLQQRGIKIFCNKAMLCEDDFKLDVDKEEVIIDTAKCYVSTITNPNFTQQIANDTMVVIAADSEQAKLHGKQQYIGEENKLTLRNNGTYKTLGQCNSIANGGYFTLEIPSTSDESMASVTDAANVKVDTKPKTVMSIYDMKLFAQAVNNVSQLDAIQTKITIEVLIECIAKIAVIAQELGGFSALKKELVEKKLKELNTDKENYNLDEDYKLCSVISKHLQKQCHNLNLTTYNQNAIDGKDKTKVVGFRTKYMGDMFGIDSKMNSKEKLSAFKNMITPSVSSIKEVISK